VTIGVNHITFAVSDLARAVRFYVEVIGCTKAATWKRGAYLRAGDMWICLSLGALAPGSRDYTHVAFTFDEDGLARLRDRLAVAGASGWQANTSEGDSIYFLDPDGHRLEAHVGNLESRLASLRAAPYDGLELHEGTVRP
jgi:catechol 2,3-dioxygenase-like lactoylglutathione lyase family enzyme